MKIFKYFIFVLIFNINGVNEVVLPNGKIIQIGSSEYGNPALIQMLPDRIRSNGNYIHHIYGPIGQVDIPINGKAEDLNIIYKADTKRFFIYNNKNSEIVIFDQNGYLDKDILEVNRMIREKFNELSAVSVESESEASDASFNSLSDDDSETSDEDLGLELLYESNS